MRAGMTRWGEGRVSRTRAGGLGLVAEVRVGGGRLGKIRGGDFGGGGRGRAPGVGGDGGRGVVNHGVAIVISRCLVRVLGDWELLICSSQPVTASVKMTLSPWSLS